MRRILRKIAAFGERPLFLWLLFLCIGVPRFLGPILAANRSLWLDEAWVANSVLGDSLADMFYYPTFLQTSPPFFLLLVRGLVYVFGVSNWSFRIVPSAMQILFALGTIWLARKTLSGPFAALAWTLCVINPVILEYSIQLKQYTTEAAASVVLLLLTLRYLSDPSRRRFLWLAIGAVLCQLFSYPTVFLLPGIILAVAWRRYPELRDLPAVQDAGKGRWRETIRGLLDSLEQRWHRAGILAVATAVVFVIEYVLLVIPNSSPALSKSWFDGRMAIMGRPVSALDAFERFTVFLSLPDPHRIRGKLALAAAALVLVWALSIVEQRFRRRRSRLPIFQMIWLAPCLLVLAASYLRQFPLSPRVCMFLLPCVVLLFVSGLQTIVQAFMKRFRPLRTPLVCAIMLATVLTGAISTDALPIWSLQQPEEDMEAATAFVQSHKSDSDLVLVHSSTSESFRFYETMFHWNPPGVKWGHTGWPCCRRGSQDSFDTPSEVQLYRDLQDNIPADFSGKIWFVYTTRYFHWQMVELYEPRETWRYFRSRGCNVSQYREFTGVAIQQYRCP
jgi:hypothetical protein